LADTNEYIYIYIYIKAITKEVNSNFNCKNY
jgi:hypothetical protein